MSEQNATSREIEKATARPAQAGIIFATDFLGALNHQIAMTMRTHVEGAIRDAMHHAVCGLLK